MRIAWAPQPASKQPQFEKKRFLDEMIGEWIEAIKEGNLDELRRILTLADQDIDVDARLRNYLKDDAQDSDYALYLQDVIPALCEAPRKSRDAVEHAINELIHHHNL